MVVPWLGLGTFTAGARGVAKNKNKKNPKPKYSAKTKV